MNYRKTLSDTCWVAKALAVLLVIVAHTNYSAIQHPVIGMFLGRLGAMAVPIFLILAGYFYHTDKLSSFWALPKKHAAGLYLPWLFCGFVVYSYTALRAGNGLAFGAAIQFLLGSGSYLYYLTVLLVLQVLFLFLRKVSKPLLLWCCLVISCASLLLTAAGFTAPLLAKLYMTNYLNIFNWCGFFALGYAAQEWEPKALICGIKKFWIPTAVLWSALLIAGYFVDGRFGYFSWLGYPMELCSSILLLRLSLALADNKWLRSLGKYSFSIYLLHIQIIPIVAKFLGGHTIGILLSPAITYAVTFGAIWFALKMSRIFKCPKAAIYLLGIRDTK